MLADQSQVIGAVEDGALAPFSLPVAAQPGKARPPAGGVGVDIVDVQRLRRLYQRWHEAFLTRLFTGHELAACRNATGYRWYSLAGRFSAEEAVKKILASGGEAARWTDIEVLNGLYGQPYISLHNETRAAFQRTGYTGLALSISHDANLAIAVVMAYS